ncbi:hypothetical protein [Neisseria sp. Ec49-e6-T10]|uniref:hypothetical protein n=1 Tax=Neisseria sp. Ec49-e6-T10 TaxID=3140744 RepID=UPI003EBBD2AD
MDELEKKNAKHKYDALKQSFKKHTSIIMVFCVLSTSFIGLGVLLLFLRSNFLVIILGVIFIAVGILLAVIGITTIYSSILYYRDRELMKKLGTNTEAKVVSIEVENIDDEQKAFTVTYQFEYRRQDYEGSDIVDTQSKIAIADFPIYIPIRFLKSDPQNSLIRKRTLSSQLKINANHE